MKIRDAQPQRKTKKTQSQNQSSSSIGGSMGTEYRDGGVKKIKKRRPVSPK